MNETAQTLITSPQGVLATLCGVVAFWFWIAEKTQWKLFQYMVPLIWIYITPVLLSNANILPSSSPVYGVMKQFALPAFICLMLISIDIGAAVRVMGKGVGVMLLGTAGIVLGAPIGYLIVHQWLDPEAWRAFGTLAGSWIGGTGNMAAAKEALETPDDLFGLVILADNVIYIFWLPILLISKGFAERFNRWARVPEDRIANMEAAVVAEGLHEEEKAPQMTDYLYLAFIASFVTALTAFLAPKVFATVTPVFPVLETMLSVGTWSVLLVTTMGIALSFTPAKRIPGSHNLAMAIVYIFVAVMGAGASLSNLGQAPAFLFGCLIWISVHGIFCLIGAWIFRVDVHSVAIASAANVGGAASAPVVAAAHRESLVPVAILMALIGYALGNYLSVAAGHLCRIVVGG